MRRSRKKKLTAGLIACLGVAVAATTTSGVAWSLPIHTHHPVLRFNTATQQIQLTLPNPACPPNTSTCEWALVVDEPDAPGQTVLAYLTGTTGTISTPFPKVCATIQADALLGPAPWMTRQGIRTTLNTCSPPPPSTGGGTAPAAASDGTSDGTGAAKATEDSVQHTLPFTGMDVEQLAVVGWALLLMGSVLMSTAESRRRLLYRTVRSGDLRQGARRVGRWLFGL